MQTLPLKLHNKLLIALAAGVALGTLAHAYGDSGAVQALGMHVLRPIGQIFLRTIFMIVVPMVFSALVIGVYRAGTRPRIWAGVAGQHPRLHRAPQQRVGRRSAWPSSTCCGRATASQLGQAGAAAAGVQTLEANAAAAKPLSDMLIELIPRNPLDSAVRALDGEMLPLMVFSLIFGVAVSRAPAADGERNLLMRVLEQVFDACMRIVHFAMRLAPVAVFAIVFNTALTFGTGIFASLLLYVVTVVAGLLLQQFVVYSALLWLVARRSPVRLLPQVPRGVRLRVLDGLVQRDAAAVAGRRGERSCACRRGSRVRADRRIDGQPERHGALRRRDRAVPGAGLRLDLTVGQQVRVMLMSIVAGIGTAGVPGGSLPMVMIVAQSVGVPAEGMALILGVDRFLDMCRTAVNVSGDLVIAALVSGRTS